MRDDGLVKYPRTKHLEGSSLQKGDEGDFLPFQSLVGKNVVLEEKMDGANCGISFGEHGEMLLQSRGHFLTGGGAEKHFNLLKEWAMCHHDMLFDLLGLDVVMYGEWMYGKHSVFYDQLPHYFLEFDLYDKKTSSFYSTNKRQALLNNKPIVSVPVLWSGTIEHEQHMETFLQSLIVESLGRGDNWKETLATVAKHRSLDVDKVLQQTDNNSFSEGLYGKIEEGDFCVGRFKYIRKSFTQTILDDNTHWNKRPIVPNQLKEGVDLYAPQLNTAWPKPQIVIPTKARKFFL